MKQLLLELAPPITFLKSLPKVQDSKINASLKLALQLSNATILKPCDWEFDPHGYTIVYLLAESHVSLHYWPECKRLMVDFFSCTKEPNFDTFVSSFEADGYTVINQEIINRIFHGVEQ